MLEGLVEDLLVRIGVWRQWQDPRPILAPNAMEQADRIEELVRESQDGLLIVRGMHAVGWFHWCNAQAQPDRALHHLSRALPVFAWLWKEAPKHVARELVPAELVESLADRGDPPQPESAEALATIIVQEALGTEDSAVLDRAITQLDDIARQITAEHPMYPVVLAHSSILLRTRYQRGEELADLIEAVRCARVSTEGDVMPHLRVTCLSALGNALHLHAVHTRDAVAMNEAVQHLRDCVELASGLPDAELAPALVALTGALMARAELTGTVPDSEAAVATGERAVREAPPGTPHHAAALHILVGAVRAQALHSDDEALMDRATELLRKLAATNGADQAYALDRLSALLVSRYFAGGDPAVLDEAVRAARGAVASAKTATAAADCAQSLVTALQARLDSNGDSALLDELVHVAQHVVDQLASNDDPRRPRALSALSVALRTRFEHQNNSDDLEQAIRFGRESVALASSDDVGGCLSNLALALKERYERRGTLTDLRDAVECGRRARAAGETGSLHTFAVALFQLYERIDEPALLDEAISVATESLDSTPPRSPGWALNASLLAVLLRRRSDRNDDQNDLDRALSFGRQAVERTPAEHPERWRRLGTLANVLHQHALNSQSVHEVAESIAITRQAFEASSGGDRPKAMLNLAMKLWNLFELDASQGEVHDEAVSLCRKVMDTPHAPAAIRMEAARNWAVHAVRQSSDPAAAFEPMSAQVELLPLMTWRGMDRSDQERVLQETGGLCGAAAAAAIAAGQPQRAVELLEQSRAVLWKQQLAQHFDLTALREAEPRLAAELVEVQHAFQTTTDVDNRVALGLRWDHAVAEVRQLPGFETFPHTEPVELREVAAEGPVVVINTHLGGWGCHALLVTTEDVEAVLLPVNHTEVVARIGDYVDALEHAERQATMVALLRYEEVLTNTLAWMWDAIAEPVLTALGFDGPPANGDEWPRVWWCPTGLTTLLPLHAAGHHDGTGRSVVDRVVSSYTPTLAALAAARNAADEEPEDGRIVVVSVPELDGGTKALPGVAADRDVLAALFPPDRRILLDGPAATVDAVLQTAPNHPWLHVGCHGQWNIRTPAAGGVRLWDGMLTIAHLSGLRHPRGEFAFIGACKTAVPSVALPDEAISLAAALCHGGYRRVIGTLWAVGDAATSNLVEAMYRRLVLDERLRPEKSAQALHDVVRQLRDEAPGSPSSWAHFVHMGA